MLEALLDVTIPSSLVTYEDKRQLLMLIVEATAIFTIPLAICSFVAGGTANMGFNIVLTALVNLAFNASSFVLVKSSRKPLAIGFLMGSSLMMGVLNFMAGVYWGQLSKCKELPPLSPIPQYSCENPTLYGAISAFAVLVFLSQITVLMFLVIWRDDIIERSVEQDEEDGINSSLLESREVSLAFRQSSSVSF